MGHLDSSLRWVKFYAMIAKYFSSVQLLLTNSVAESRGVEDTIYRIGEPQHVENLGSATSATATATVEQAHKAEVTDPVLFVVRRKPHQPRTEQPPSSPHSLKNVQASPATRPGGPKRSKQIGFKAPQKSELQRKH